MDTQDILKAIQSYVMGWIANTSINADQVDGYHAGSASGQVPVYTTGTWTPTFGGFSIAPANPICRYTLVGKLMILNVATPTMGTSNATTFTLTLPPGYTTPVLTSMVWGNNWFVAVDNSVYLATPARVSIGNNTNIIDVFKINTSAASWTASGTKGVYFTLILWIA